MKITWPIRRRRQPDRKKEKKDVEGAEYIGLDRHHEICPFCGEEYRFHPLDLRTYEYRVACDGARIIP